MRIEAKKILLVVLLLLACAGGILWINRDLYHFESIHRIKRSFEAGDRSGIYRLTTAETLKRGDYSFEFVTDSPSAEERYVILEGEDVLVEGALDGGPVPFSVEKSSQQITAGVFYGGSNTDFYVAEINFISGHVLTRDSFLYHVSLSVCLLLFTCWLIFRLVFPERFRDSFIGRWLTPQREALLLFLLVLTALICIPFYRPEYVKADDSTYHMARIEGLKTTLEKGIFPPRLYLFYMNGYGYPGGIFYPDIMLYFPALLRLLGFNFILTYKIFIFFLNFLNVLAMYLCVSRITGSRLPGITASILYGLNAYRLIDVFYRGAVGEIQAFIFIPLIILGLYYVFRGETKRWWVLAVGCTGLVLSHLISVMLCAILMLLFFLINLGKIFRSREIFLALLKVFLVSLGLCAYFLLPLAEQLLTNEVISSHTWSGGIPLYALLQNRTIWEIPVKPYPGYPLLFSCLLFLIPARKPFKNRGVVLYTVLFALIAFFCATSLFPWQKFPWLNLHIQFPWRFFIPAIPLLITAVTVTFHNRFDSHDQKVLLPILAVFCILSAVPIYQSAFTRWMDSRGYVMENNRTGSNMYLPIGFEPDFVDKNRDTVLSSDPDFRTLSHKRGNLSFTFAFETDDEEVDFEIPLLYYTGYKAELKTDDGIRELETSRGDHGFVRVHVSRTGTGSVTARYVKTIAQHAGDLITLLTAALCIGIPVVRRRRDRQ